MSMWYQWFIAAPTMTMDRPWSIGVVGKLARDLYDLLAADTGDFLLPGRCERNVLVVVVGDIVAAQATVDAIVGHHQVVDRGDFHLAAVGRADVLHGHIAKQHVIVVAVVPELVGFVRCEMREGHRSAPSDVSSATAAA